MNVIRKLQDAVHFLCHSQVFSWRERIQVMNRLTHRLTIHDLFMRRLHHDAEGVAFIEAGRQKFYFDPGYPIHDGEVLLHATSQVLCERFIFNPYLRFPVTVRPGDVVVDLGANIGVMAMQFAEATGPRGTVYAFEPITHDVLRKNVAANRLGNIVVKPLAIGDQVRNLQFVLSDNPLMSRSTELDRNPGIELPVPVTTLDQFAEDEGLTRLDFIKVDIEGAEEEAIRGARRTIERFKPKWSISSYHIDRTGERQHPKLVSLLTEMGYRVRTRDDSHIWAW